MKGLQFRSIAPKAPPVASSNPLLSCQQPTGLSEASTAVSPKSVLVLSQNYAFMQVPGQDATYSLVAFPQPQQQQPMQKNLKLPIPRYQSVRSKSAPEKACNKMTSPLKVSTTTKAQQAAVKSEQNSDLSDLVRVESAASSEITALLQGSTAGPKLEQDNDGQSLKNHGCLSGASKSSLVGNIAQVKMEGPPTAASAITVLSPTLFSKSVQIISSPPKGKLPILPYAKVKNSLLVPTPARNTFLEKQVLSEARSSPDNRAKTIEGKVKTGCFSQDLQLKKSQGKKRGRKRKTMEDILAFEARKKRSLSFFRRRVPDKPPLNVKSFVSQEKLLYISKKFRSIRPKPVLVLEATLPQLVQLPSLVNSEANDQLSRQQMTEKAINCQPSQPTDQHVEISEARGAVIYTGSHLTHRCPTCSRCFQFKHHLKSHMNSHSNLRPYVCPVCRKAYAHSGSLSTHMKLHHAESRPRKSLCCEFCEKSFGYVGVYFSHLREVHRVILTVEPSISQHEVTSMEESLDPEEQASEQHIDPVELQIKCGRCQATTPTFADMKLHLLYVHGEEVQVLLKDGAMRGGREAEDELVKHAAHYWRQLNEKRNLVHCGACDEETFTFSKFKRHLHCGSVRGSQGDEVEDGTVGKLAGESRDLGKNVALKSGFCLNCILCTKVFSTKQEVLEHWRTHHNCENPTLLWDVLDFRGEKMPVNRLKSF